MTTAQQPTILVVDDLQDNLDLIEEYFEDESYRIIVAHSAKEALAAVEQNIPDLAILDVQMAETNGFELLRQISELYPIHPIPTLFLTAHCGTTIEKVHGLQAGARDYITKPVDRMELLARVNAIFRTESEHVKQIEQSQRIVRRLMS